MEYIKFFKELTIKDVPLVGGKNASLGEMYQHLTKKGVNIPNGFAVTSNGYRYFIEENKLESKIKQALKKLNIKNINSLKAKGSYIRELILSGVFPEDLKAEIVGAYKKLGSKDVAVRSSATAEDLPDASFAGQQETYLNVRTNYHLLESVKKCLASLFTDRAIVYREEQGFKHMDVYLSVGVQNMVRSDQASAGVMFTIDTESGHPNVIVINAAYGLGEYIVKGVVTPDEYYIHKPNLKQGYKSIVGKQLGAKAHKLVYGDGDNILTKDSPVTRKDRNKFALSDAEILQLAKWGLVIEKHYGGPMDIEWAKDGRTKKMYIVQARPETIHSNNQNNEMEEYSFKRQGTVLVEGSSVGAKVGVGKVRVIDNPAEMNQFKQGEVLVTDITDPDWVPIMKKAVAIVTDSGGRTSHAAIVSRELGLPCVVGTGNATQVLKTGQMVTVSCAEGEYGHVYQGKVPFTVRKVKINKHVQTKTKVMMNIGDPDIAFRYSQVPNNGVGLARLEFIINGSVKAHPLALLDYHYKRNPKLVKKKHQNFNKLDKKTYHQISKLIRGYKNPIDYYTERVSLGIAKIAAGFYPREVIVRFSDFKSNEYANLLGGKFYEPEEQNAMLGWRGASRYYSEGFKDAFNLECEAIKRVREVMGFYNVSVMVPFCRTPEEGKKVIAILKSNGLLKVAGKSWKAKRKKLKTYVMCEIPSNVILAEDFAKVFDGFSIGSNDLTQLVLGVDRDSGLVSHIYNERNKAVKQMIASVIKTAHKKGKKIGICGQAPSDFPDFLKFLVEQGIDSVSLNPDTVMVANLKISTIEKSLKL